MNNDTAFEVNVKITERVLRQRNVMVGQGVGSVSDGDMCDYCDRVAHIKSIVEELQAMDQRRLYFEAYAGPASSG